MRLTEPEEAGGQRSNMIPENTMLKSPRAPTAAPYVDLVQLHADPSHLVILAL